MREKNLAGDNALLIDRRKTIVGNPIFWLQTTALLSGFALLYYVVYKIGFKTLLEVLSRVGWGFLLIIFLNGSRHILRAFCLYLALPPALRTIKFRSVIAARLGGEAVSFLTFTGPFLGETTKAVLLKKSVPAAHGGAAVVIDNFLYYVSVIAVILRQ